MDLAIFLLIVPGLVIILLIIKSFNDERTKVALCFSQLSN